MQLLSKLFENQKEKSNDTSSDSSLDEKSNIIAVKKQNLPTKFTSLNNILSYFKFFIETQNENSQPSYHSKIPLIAANIQLNNSIINLIEKLQKVLKKEGKNQEVLLDFQTTKQIQNYQRSTHQQLQRTLLGSKRFNKQKTFTSEILIHEVESSKHSQITTLQIQLLWYKTSITILNQLDETPPRLLTNFSCFGTFGSIYIVEVQNRQFAIKSIQFKKKFTQQSENSNNSKSSEEYSFQKIQAIKEYFYLLLFSQLQIGPQVKTIGGFDLIIYDQSIEFATEICLYPKKEKQMLTTLKQSLFQMHTLQIVHRDIKPSNVMFSPTFNKNVFIDFGGTQALNEKIGERTVTKFVGTISYCSDEVLLLFSQKGIAVDLYYSDVFGLNKYFNLISEQMVNVSLKDQDEIGNKTPQINHMDQKQQFSYQLINLKYLLHTENYEMFHALWKSLIIKHQDQALIFEIKILSFFKELKPNNFLREFYRNQISQAIRELPQFKELEQIFQNDSCELNYYLNLDFNKKQHYTAHKRFYTTLEIDYGNYTTDEKQILKSLLDQQSIKQSIAYLSQKISTTFKQTSDISNLCLIVAHYCSVSSNLYRISIEQKIRICQQTLKIIQQHDKNSFNNLKITFKCPNQTLNTINIFYHYFIQRVFKKIPSKFRSKLMVKAFSSLCLLGFPTNNNRMGIEFLLNQLIKQDDQDENNSVHILKSKDANNQIKMEKILLYWEYKVVLLFFDDMFYNRNKTNSLLQRDQEELKRMNLATMSLMQPKDNEENQFYKINFRLYEILIVTFKDFNRTISNEFCQILISPALLHLESSSKIIRKWKKLMQTLQFVFARAYQVQNTTKLKKNAKKQIIPKFYLDETIFMYLILCQFSNFFQTRAISQQVLNKIDIIVGSKEISLRFKLEMRFSNTLQKKDFEKLKQLCSFIRNLIDYSSVSQENIEFIKKILLIIYGFFVRYIQKLPNLNTELKLLIVMCYEVINLGMEIGINYFKQKSFQSIALLFSKAKEDHKSDIIEFADIVKQINDMKLLKNFAVTLISTGQTYKKIIDVIHKEKCNQQTKFIKNLDEKYYLFLNGLKQNKFIMDFSSIWISFLYQNQYIRNSIKSDRITSIFIAQLLIEQRKSRQQVMLSHQIIEDFFGEISVNRLKSQSESQSSNFPTFQIAFDYFQIKLLKTNYDPYWCEQLIESYKLYENQDYFKVILFQDSLIKFLFNCYIYTEKNYTKIQKFLQNLTEILRTTVTTKIILSVKTIFSAIFNCLCKECFPRQPPSSWDPYKFTKHLFLNLKLQKASQNPYMSLVYYYSMKKKALSFKMCRKFIIFILKSLQYLFRPVKQILISEIYQFAFQLARPQPNTLRLHQQTLKQQKMKKIQRSKMNDKKQRKLIYLYCQFMKHQQECADLIDDLIEKRLVKEYYIKGYTYPVFIRKLLIKKLRRYHEVKQNYKQVQQITELTKSYISKERLSLLN